MKIALLTPTFFKYSGIDRVAQSEAEELSRKNEVAVFTFQADIKPKNYKVYEFGMPSNQTFQRIYRLFFLIDFFKIASITRQLKQYDEILSFFYPMTIPGTIAKKFYGKRYVYHNHGVAYPGLFSSITERTYMRMLNFFTNLSVKNADSAISVSKFLRDELKTETGLESEVRYNKVNKKFNKKLNKKKIASIIRKHHLKRPVLLYVGRIVQHKRIDLLIKAFRMVKEKIPETTMLIVGKSTDKAYLEKLNSISREPVFTGFVPDDELPHYYGACDLYTTASLWEGFNLPAAEAQACGKKVVAFDVGSHPEIVRNGMLVKGGDVKAFAQAIIKTLGKTRHARKSKKRRKG